jgi:hypothetical protein
MYINEVSPLEDKLSPLVFTGDESDEQLFVYHYKCNADNERGWYRRVSGYIVHYILVMVM